MNLWNLRCYWELSLTVFVSIPVLIYCCTLDFLCLYCFKMLGHALTCLLHKLDFELSNHFGGWQSNNQFYTSHSCLRKIWLIDYISSTIQITEKICMYLIFYYTLCFKLKVYFLSLFIYILLVCLFIELQ